MIINEIYLENLYANIFEIQDAHKHGIKIINKLYYHY